MTQATDGVIHDIGYQRYTGPRLGHWYAMRSLYVQGLRTAFGIGRGAKAKIFPWLVVGIFMMAAAIIVVIRSEGGMPYLPYHRFIDGLSTPTILFVAIVAPELFCRDLRSKALSLYFSRPLSRTEYAMARFASVVTATALLLLAPVLLVSLGEMFSIAHDTDDVLDALLNLAQSSGYAIFVAVVLSSIASLVASLTSKRTFGAGGIVALFLASGPVAAVLAVVLGPDREDYATLVCPPLMLHQFAERAFALDSNVSLGVASAALATAIGMTAVSVLGLLLRYRKVGA